MRPKIDAVDFYPEEVWDEEGYDYMPYRLEIGRGTQRQYYSSDFTADRYRAWRCAQRMYRICKQRGGEFREHIGGEWHWRAK